LKAKPVDSSNVQTSGNHPYRTAGMLLIGSGFVYILDQWLHTGWLTLLVLPFLGAVGFIYGIRNRLLPLAIPGALVSGLGWGGFFLLNRSIPITDISRGGLFLVCLGASFGGILATTMYLQREYAYWSLVPGLLLISSGIPLILDRITFFAFVISIGIGLGLSFLIWGTLNKLFGLIIPGCLLLGIAPGIFFAWSKAGDFNGLTETGVMLVWFALGWGLITIASRILTPNIIWWPLIPGGLLAVVGWGLYIGGDPGNALSFIGNTGSIGLIIFGIYLLLLRRSFKD
jgi:hypothetical protein